MMTTHSLSSTLARSGLAALVVAIVSVFATGCFCSFEPGTECRPLESLGATLLRETGQLGESHASVVATGTDGSVYVGGHADGGLGDRNYNDIFLARTGRKARLEGTELGERAEDLPSGAGALTSVSDGTMLAAGWTSDSDRYDSWKGGTYDGFAVKFDGEGEPVWTCLVGTERDDKATDVVPDGDGGAYVTGRTAVPLEPSAHHFERQDAYLAHCDSKGRLDAFRRLELGKETEPPALARAPNSDMYIVVSTSGTIGSDDVSGPRFDVQLVKFDPSGDRVWRRTLGRTAANQPVDVAATDDRVYVGATADRTFTGRTPPGYRTGFVVSYGDGGDHLWTRPATRDESSDLFALTVDDTGAIYAAGWTRREPQEEEADGQMDAFVTKLDRAGGRQWTRRLGGAYGDLVNDIAVDDRVYLVGRYASPVAEPYFNDGTLSGFTAVLRPGDGAVQHVSVFETDDEIPVD